MPKFCPTCGKPLQFENAEICPNCGVRIKSPTISPPSQSKESNIGKYLIIAIILFIGIIILAVVFSYVVLGAGFFSTQKAQETVYKGGAQETVYKGVEQSTANIQMIGNVYGLAETPAAGIDAIKFSFGLAPGSPQLDLTRMKVVFSVPANFPVILQWTSGTQDTTHFTAKINGQGNSVATMTAGQIYEIYFNVIPVPKKTMMNFEIRPTVGAPLPFSKTTPLTIQTTNVLN
jgi:flagellin FlaB